MPEKDHHARKLNQGHIVLNVIFVANYQAAEVVEPGKEPLDFPSALEPAQRSAILGFALHSASAAMGRDHFRAEAGEHFLVERVAVIGFVPDQPFWNVGDKPRFERLADQLHFSRASTLCEYGERKTMAVRNRHELTALAPLGLSDAEPPFFAGTNVPSIKLSRRSSPPRSLRSCATANSTCSSTFERTQFWNRRCTVWYGPYRSGKSCQRAPVRRIHRIPFSTVRRSLQGRPRRSARTRSGGRMVSIICHCWSVRSIRHKYTLYKKVQETFCHTFHFPIYEMASR